YWVWGLCTLAALAGCDDDDAAAAMGDGDAEIRGLQTGSSGRDMAVFTQPGSPTTIGVDAAVDTPGNPGGDTAPGNGPMGGGAATEAGCSPDIACATEGLSECFGGDTVRTCERNAETGCIEWSAPTLCAVGQRCIGMACAADNPDSTPPGCNDQCSPGQSQCAGNDVQLCGRDQNGCNVWSDARACANGAACVNGQCPEGAGPCADNPNACFQINAVQCVSPQLFRFCTQDRVGCLVWSAPARCPGGGQCVDNECIPPGAMSGGRNCLFEDRCQPGETRCQGANVVQNCVLSQATGCYDFFGGDEFCQGGSTCENGACVAPEGNVNMDPPRCGGIDECNAGDTRCNRDLVQDCIIGADGCGRWGFINQCQNAAEVCENGQCVNPAGATCDDQECVPGTQRCDPNDGTATNVCEGNADGCGQWSEPERCDHGDVCRNGRCVGPDQGQNCAVDCQLDDQRCDPDLGSERFFEECVVDRENPGCNTWADNRDRLVNYCLPRQVCIQVGNQTGCADEEPNNGGGQNCETCLTGETRCFDNQRYQLCEGTEGGCGVWSAPLVCPLGDCVNNQCQN
ncbi:MAG: hypothetical protein VX589_01875, partial [Myxococcota bacterium]|nr:hypothetical protein [Myxococcota bacterium]